MPEFHTLRPGLVPYAGALELQQELIERRRRGGADVLVLLRHPPVVTLGRGAREDSLLFSPQQLAERGIACERVGRGGDVTFHGPGQCVGYPIVHLDLAGRDVHRFLRLLEETLIRALRRFGIAGRRVDGRTGVWVDGAKVASIGIGVRHWISWHGWALNVEDDLIGFDAIVPCGLPDVRMTSVSALLGRPVAVTEAEDALIDAFAETFHLEHAGHYEFETDAQT